MQFDWGWGMTPWESIIHGAEVGGLLLAYLSYRADRGKDAADRAKARENMVEVQTNQHAENRNRLELLSDFQRAQLIINTKRDEQVAQLITGNALLTQMMGTMDRRMQRIEDKNP